MKLCQLQKEKWESTNPWILTTFYKYYSYVLNNETSSLLDYFDKDNTIFVLSNLSAIKENYSLFMQEMLDYKLELYEKNHQFIEHNLNLDLDNLLSRFNFIKIDGKNIAEVCEMSIIKMHAFITNLKLNV